MTVPTNSYLVLGELIAMTVTTGLCTASALLVEAVVHFWPLNRIGGFPEVVIQLGTGRAARERGGRLSVASLVLQCKIWLCCKKVVVVW